MYLSSEESRGAVANHSASLQTFHSTNIFTLPTLQILTLLVKGLSASHTDSTGYPTLHILTPKVNDRLRTWYHAAHVTNISTATFLFVFLADKVFIGSFRSVR